MDIYVDMLGITGYYPNYPKKKDLMQKYMSSLEQYSRKVSTKMRVTEKKNNLLRTYD